MATGYVKDMLGLYTFNFQTLKSTDSISDTQVSADVDTDLYLKGKQSQINYNNPTAGLQGLSSAGNTLENPMLDTLSSQIGSYGPIVKEAKDLEPGETLTVKGEYAFSWWRLYLSGVIWVLVIIAVIIFGIYWLSRYLKKRKLQAAASAPVMPGTPVHPVAYEGILLPTAGVGLVVALVIIGLNYLIGSLNTFINGSFNTFGGMTTAITLIVIILLYGLVLIGPAVWFGAKHGWKAAILLVVFEIVWLIILALAMTVLFQNRLTTPGYYAQPDIVY
jgi:hypothetical protein